MLKEWGVEATAGSLILFRRIGAMYLALALMFFLGRAAAPSDLRSAVCLVMGGAIALLAGLGLFEFLARRVSAGVFRSVVGEAVLAAGFVWVWWGGQMTARQGSTDLIGNGHVEAERIEGIAYEARSISPFRRPGRTAAGRGEDYPKRGGAKFASRSGRRPLNPMDGKIRRGEIKAISGFRFPRGLGHDFAGVVEAIGPGVKRLKVGDEVFGVTSIRQAGAFAEYVIADEKNVWRKPSSISFEHAAALTIVSLTAWNALVAKARLSAGQSVFITGCLGGVGRSAVQIARMRGANDRRQLQRVGTRGSAGAGRGRGDRLSRLRHRFAIGTASTWSSIQQARCR